MKFTIRKAKPTDIQAILTIERLGTNSWKENFFMDELKNPLSVLLVAEQDNVILGFIIAWIVHDDIQLNNIAVLPDYRRQGIAKALIKEIVALFQDAKKIILEVNVNNSAKQFYEKLGFIITGKRKSYYGNDDAYLMEKTLIDEI